MNIFVSDIKPEIAARNLDDKRVVKMILESAQLLSNNFHYRGEYKKAPFRPVFINHPITRWVASSWTNYSWLLEHFISLLEEFKKRFNREHSWAKYTKILYRESYFLLEYPFFYNCTRFKELETIKAYRLHLMFKWRYLDVRVVKWTNCKQPDWYVEIQQELEKILENEKKLAK